MQPVILSRETSATFHASMWCTAFPHRKLHDFSPFFVTKTLTATIGEGYMVKKIANGDVLLEVLYKHQHEKLSELTSFGGIPVSASEHRSQNRVRGVISEDDLKYLTEKELLEGLKEEYVTNVYLIKIRRENGSGLAQLTLDMQSESLA